MIEITNLTKIYNGSFAAIKNINLTITGGEFIFIVGASGSGKSTLLKLLTKEETITSGDITVYGERLSKMKRRTVPYYRRTMGIVFQDFRLIEKMTVYENVAFAMRILGKSSREIRKRVELVLSQVSLEGKLKRLPCELSGGEKQRVGIARALVNKPRIIIADEPTGNVDPSMSYELVELLSNANKQGTTVITVTHDIDIVEKFPFRVIEIAGGKILKDEVEKND